MGVFRRGFKAMFERGKWKVLRGDRVMVTAGKDAGQVGTVLKVIRDQRFPRVVVEGLNLNKRHIKRSKDNPGGVVSVESPLHYSNVALVDPVSDRPVRASWRYLEDGTKVRVSVGRGASGSIIARPEVLKQRRKPRLTSTGPADTPLQDAGEVTHTPGDLPAMLKAALGARAGRRPELVAAAAEAAQQQAAQQQVRHYSTGGGGLSSYRSVVAAAAARVLSGAGRLPPLSRSGVAASWRGFAASLW